MEKEPTNPNPDESIEKAPAGATDMELALFLAGHIDNPCQAEVEPGVMENIRYVYLKEARDQLPKMTNEHAKEFLKLKIKEYEGWENTIKTRTSQNHRKVVFG